METHTVSVWQKKQKIPMRLNKKIPFANLAIPTATSSSLPEYFVLPEE